VIGRGADSAISALDRSGLRRREKCKKPLLLKNWTTVTKEKSDRLLNSFSYQRENLLMYYLSLEPSFLISVIPNFAEKEINLKISNFCSLTGKKISYDMFI